VKIGRWRHVPLVILGVLTMWLLIKMPRSHYEWMLNDPALANEHLTYCTLPVDNDAGIWPILGFMLLIPMLLIAGISSVIAVIRRHPGWPVSWGYALFLTLFWAWRFFIAVPVCR
jgi:hypothetical protein